MRIYWITRVFLYLNSYSGFNGNKVKFMASIVNMQGLGSVHLINFTCKFKYIYSGTKYIVHSACLVFVLCFFKQAQFTIWTHRPLKLSNSRKFLLQFGLNTCLAAQVFPSIPIHYLKGI